MRLRALSRTTAFALALACVLASAAWSLAMPLPARADGPTSTPAPAASRREPASSLSAPPPGVRSRPFPGPSTRADDAARHRNERGGLWAGPRVELGYAHYVVSDAHGGGDVNTAVFSGFLPTMPLRIGASAEAGTRIYALASNDAVLRASLVAGYQLIGELGPLSPYAAAVVTAGIVLGKRFHTPVSNGIYGGGVELGFDLMIAAPLWAELALSYLRLSMDDLAYDVWLVRLGLGL